MTTWTGTGRAGIALVVSLVGVLLIGLLVGLLGSPVAGLAVVVLTGAAIVGFMSNRVEVGAAGLAVQSGVFPFLHVRFPLEQIRQADAIDVNPWRWGGWGYRGSVRVFRRAAWILHKGEGIKLDLVGGGWFVVTVDDAATGAAELNQLLTSK
jgi:hypothetical protein